MRALALASISLALAACGPSHDTTSPAGEGSASGAQAALSAVAPIMGGTVTVALRGRFVAITDPERHRVSVVDVQSGAVRGHVRFPAGSLPWRAAIDGRGDLRVVLRGTGQLATIGLQGPSLRGTQSVCPEPRGVTWDESQRRILVACAGGELVSIPELGSSSSTFAGLDLRDVVVRDGKPFVSSFRAARLEGVDSTEHAVPPSIPTPALDGGLQAFEPQVAWRTFETQGRIVMVHQRHLAGDVSALTVGAPPVVVPYYVNACNTAVVRSAVTVFERDGGVTSAEIPGVLPVDADVSPDGRILAIASAGNLELTQALLPSPGQVFGFGACGLPARPAPLPPADRPNDPPPSQFGQVVGVRYLPDETLIVHSRDPAQLTIVPPPGSTLPPRVVPLASDRIDSPGTRLFHAAPTALACASCHPEGTDDGHVWTFFGEPRRTQTLWGGLSRTAPFHWKGDLTDLRAVMNQTFVARMGGRSPDEGELDSLQTFLDTVKAPAPSQRDDAALVASGARTFEKSCSTCHAGSLLTNGQTVSVGSGAPGARFQVPSLKGLLLRPPYMHDGCAKTLGDRFQPGCGGTAHGTVSPQELDGLLAYLKTL